MQGRGAPPAGNARYLLRFDDICPNMDWRNWREIEDTLLSHGVKPILAVVPDNKDPKLIFDADPGDFWDRVRVWQSWNWTIAIHGWQHVYVNHNAGIMGLTKKSEFATLPRREQSTKISQAVNKFKAEGVLPTCWVAPSHSFDEITVEVLAENGIRAISDGLWSWPHGDSLGVTWVPQQIWSTIRPMPPGVWTSCFHHNGWNSGQLHHFKDCVARFSHLTASFDEIVTEFQRRQITPGDRRRAHLDLLWNHRIRPRLARLKGYRPA